jgi:5'-nucleotidase
MKLLISNDDGIHSEGLHRLVTEMEKSHEVVVIAPDSQRSACGHSITLNKPLYIKEVKLEGISSKCYSVDGTPADCVKFGVEKILTNKIDMVLSGINKGPNLGTDVIYSGTVSAAIEAAIYKIPSAAISLDIRNNNEKYDVAARYARYIIENAYGKFTERNIVLNINVPDVGEEQIKGIKVCELGNRIYQNTFIEKMMEDNKIGYQLAGKITDVEKENTDVSFIKNGYITLTPLHYDLTNYKLIKEVDGWFSGKHTSVMNYSQAEKKTE